MVQAPTYPQSEAIESEEEEDSGPPIRIRHLLLLGLLGGAAWWAHPRLLAAWNLHDQATHVANYALCMGGPTAPALLRDTPDEFQRLIRRRLVASAPNERPFSRCAETARAITGSEESERLHRSTAWSFREYGFQRGKAGVSLAQLQITTGPLAELAREGWPFVRGGYTKLVKTSSTAKGAPHPVRPPRPGLGRGLPSWRAAYRSVRTRGPGSFVVAFGRAANLSAHQSDDGGLTWKAARLNDGSLDRFTERCPGNEHRSFTLGASDDGDFITSTSHGPDGAPFTTRLTASSARVVAAACDDKAFVVATVQEERRSVSLHLCRYRQTCRPVPLPEFRGTGVRPSYPLDVARVDGVTVLSVPMGETVRVVSSRDDGVSWTPFSVAFDRTEHPLRPGSRLPDRLLRLGKRLVLYGGAKKLGQSYPVLVSDDSGASWQTP